MSKIYIQENGTPQGAIISPTIFNLLINKATKISKNFKNIEIGQYADDTAIWVRAKGAPRRYNYSKVRKKNLNKN